MVGVSGSGKSTYAEQVARATGWPRLELDAVFHQQNWTPLERNEFQRRVSEATAPEAWVVDGNYRAVRPILVERAQVVVGFDLPKSLVMRQVTTRSLRRRIHNEELWNGNRESWRNLFSTKKERNIVLWSWQTYDEYRERLDWLERLVTSNGAEFVRVHSHEEATREIASRLGPHASTFLG